MSDTGSQLHERLAADTVRLGQGPLSDVLLMNDSHWPWVLLVPRVAEVREIYELPVSQQQQLLAESACLGRGMMALFGGDKLNVAALGNMVPQLHLHHIVRFAGDPAWPGPVWGKVPAEPYSEAALAEITGKLQPLVAEISRLGE